MGERSRSKGKAHLVGVVYSKDVAGQTRTLSLSRRICTHCHGLCLAVRGLGSTVLLVDSIRPSLDAGVDLEAHQCGRITPPPGRAAGSRPGPRG